MTSKPVKKLKPSKPRIYLRDGRELQFNPPFRRAEPINLLSQIPEAHRKDPIEVEIGPGKGEFLARRAGEYPERFFVGIDKRMDRAELTRRKLERLPTAGSNWMILREDARSFLEGHLPPIQVLHIYHPDPWPKSRHHKNRIFRSPDARRWAEAIVPGGELRLSTDHHDYFEEILDVVDTWEFLRFELVVRKTALTGDPMTHFEGIFLRKNEPVYKAYFRRI